MNKKLKLDDDESVGIKLDEPQSIFISGRCKSGKSVFAKWLLYIMYQNRIFDQLILVCPTAEKNWPFVNKRHIVPAMTDEMVKKLLSSQDRLGAKMPRVLLVLDDIVGTTNLISPAYKSLFSTYRHRNITIILLSQKLKLIAADLRDSVDYPILFQLNNPDAYENSFHAFAMSLNRSDKKIWREIVDTNTGDYNALVIDRNNTSPNIEDKYLVMRAPAEFDDKHPRAVKFYIR